MWSYAHTIFFFIDFRNNGDIQISKNSKPYIYADSILHLASEFSVCLRNESYDSKHLPDAIFFDDDIVHDRSIEFRGKRSGDNLGFLSGQDSF